MVMGVASLPLPSSELTGGALGWRGSREQKPVAASHNSNPIAPDRRTATSATPARMVTVRVSPSYSYAPLSWGLVLVV